MPWGTDKDGHYYISPVEQEAMNNERNERRIAMAEAELAKKKPKTYVEAYANEDPYAVIKDQFCRCVIELENAKNLQRECATGSDEANNAARQVTKLIAIYNALFKQISRVYGGNAMDADKVIIQNEITLTKREKANIRNDVAADLFFRLVDEIVPERKQGVIQMVDEALDAELRKRGVQVG